MGPILSKTVQLKCSHNKCCSINDLMVPLCFIQKVGSTNNPALGSVLPGVDGEDRVPSGLSHGCSRHQKTLQSWDSPFSGWNFYQGNLIFVSVIMVLCVWMFIPWLF